VGTSTNALLCYGYDLGGGETEWHLAEVDDDELSLPWLDLDELEEDGLGLEDAFATRLLASVGFTETDYSAKGYRERKREAEATIGVELEYHCSSDYPLYILSAKTITARRGDTEAIDMAALEAERIAGDWDGKLAAACAALGITPTKPAGWWLVSYWST
jgi:hypothetical protein